MKMTAEQHEKFSRCPDLVPIFLDFCETMFVMGWASWREELLLEERRYRSKRKVPLRTRMQLWLGRSRTDWCDSVSGCELMDVAPLTEEYLEEAMKELLPLFISMVPDGYEPFSISTEEYEDGGHCMAMEVVGSGVSWFDDHDTPAFWHSKHVRCEGLMVWLDGPKKASRWRCSLCG